MSRQFIECGDIFLRYRVQNNLTQVELAKKLRIGIATLRRAEISSKCTKRVMIKLEELAKENNDGRNRY